MSGTKWAESDRPQRVRTPCWVDQEKVLDRLTILLWISVHLHYILYKWLTLSSNLASCSKSSPRNSFKELGFPFILGQWIQLMLLRVRLQSCSSLSLSSFRFICLWEKEGWFLGEAVMTAACLIKKKTKPLLWKGKSPHEILLRRKANILTLLCLLCACTELGTHYLQRPLGLSFFGTQGDICWSVDETNIDLSVETWFSRKTSTTSNDCKGSRF